MSRLNIRRWGGGGGGGAVIYIFFALHHKVVRNKDVIKGERQNVVFVWRLHELHKSTVCSTFKKGHRKIYINVDLFKSYLFIFKPFP